MKLVSWFMDKFWTAITWTMALLFMLLFWIFQIVTKPFRKFFGGE